MPDNHCKIAAILHICIGACFLLIPGAIMMFLGGLSYLFHPSNMPEAQAITVVAGLGAVFFALLALNGLAQIGAAVAFLKGSGTGRTVLIIFSVIDLFIVPIGTVVGAYSLWALLRKKSRPTARPGSASAQG